jgi:hypothetical protein
VLLQYALNYLGSTCLLTGDLDGARQTIEEDRLISQAIGGTPVGYVEPWYLALRGREAHATRTIDHLVRGAATYGHGRMLDRASFYRDVLYNGLGRPKEALESLAPVFERDVVGYFAFFVPELAEAAARADNRPILEAVGAWLAERAALTPTEWLLGIDARVRALASDSAAADALHREARSIESYASAQRDRPGALALRRMAAPPWAPNRRSAAVAGCVRHLDHDGARRFRRQSPPRVAGYRRDRPPTR